MTALTWATTSPRPLFTRASAPRSTWLLNSVPSLGGERPGRAGERYAAIDGAMLADETRAVEILREWARERLDALYTEPGRRLGESRSRSMEEFFAQFDAQNGAEGAR